MNENRKTMVIQLAKSRTEDVFRERLAKLEEVNSQWAQWLDIRKNECASCSFLQRGLRRWGKVTSNGVESANGAVLENRKDPVVYMLEGLMAVYRRRSIDGLKGLWLKCSSAVA